MSLAAAASLAGGGVDGDHCPPISVTPIMARQAAHCGRVNPVKTQLPYAGYVATIGFICFIVAGFARSALSSLVVGVALLVGGLALVKASQAAFDAWRQKWRGAAFALVGWGRGATERGEASREWRLGSEDDDDYDEETTMRVTMDVGDKDDPNITGPQADAFAQELLEIEEAEFKEVVLDFSNVETLSSMAMGSLFATYQKLAEQKRKLSIVHPRESIRRLLRMFKMDSLIADDGKGAKG
ncbi:MAG: STAS domain-containing protein [Planctomycetes bacterium]|nr:STAS domain-containing protein [Planctomycetota bacterium]